MRKEVMLTVAALALTLVATGATAATNYDVIILAQTWPTTTCLEWRERDDSNTCNLPSAAIWTVHGIWPSKLGQKGPNNCRSDIDFNEGKLAPIISDLNRHWTNVHKNSGKYSFWEHEWSKHGTCAVDNPQLSDEFKYFSKGIELNEAYPIGTFLQRSGVVPGNLYSWYEIFSAVEKQLGGKNPAVQCQYNEDMRKHTLAQISICLDKDSLRVIDCKGIYGGLNQGCPRKGAKIFYPKVPGGHPSGSKWWIIVLAVGAGLILVGVLVWVYRHKFHPRFSNQYQSI